MHLLRLMILLGLAFVTACGPLQPASGPPSYGRGNAGGTNSGA
ncbi:hypothetical protein ACFQY5_31805 [Paeniroseomonas aquatica]|uniref:Uncharacterized protein n=1 Tax=Paeniroseomonas aquatica TaxID=373043 RepID=A0ABT8A9Z8_9PROT|nr:hypothetical protein [Paeniroseomonas aquatica]MDN3566647.1 hypothetical protein [Paeniroseomonas aquatica]